MVRITELEFFREQKAIFTEPNQIEETENEEILNQIDKNHDKNQLNYELNLKKEIEKGNKMPKIERILSPLVFFMTKFRTQIIGVTGTKGKTTTSSLIEHFLKHKIGNGKFERGNLEKINDLQNTKLGEKLENIEENLEEGLNNNLESQTKNQTLAKLQTQNWQEITDLHVLNTNLAENLGKTKSEFAKNWEGKKLENEEFLKNQNELQNKSKLEQKQKIIRQLSDNQKVFYCGNTTGVSPYNYWRKLNQKLDPQKFFVVELSSFQLQDLNYSHISPKYAVITNFFVDHLDQHNNKFEYWKAKTAIFTHQIEGDFLVSGEQFLQQTEHLGSQIYREIGNSKIDQYYFENPQNQQFIIWKEIFGFLKEFYTTDLIGEHNWQNLILAMFVSEIVCEIFGQNKESKIRESLINLERKLTETKASEFEIEKVRLQLENWELETPKQISFYDILQNLIRWNKGENQKIINIFQPVKHRLELIKTVQIEMKKEDFINPENPKSEKKLINFVDSNLNVRFWDDGAATEPDAVIACVNALTTQENEFLWLWITGVDKGVDLTSLAQKILEKIKENKIWKLTLCGQIGANLLSKIEKNCNFEKKYLNKITICHELHKFKNELEYIDFEDEINYFVKNVEKPNTIQANLILNIALSPCGSSFDEFKNYKERSEFWRQKVEKTTQQFDQTLN